MFRITQAQMQHIQRGRLMVIRQEICGLLSRKFPLYARPNDPAIEAFVGRAMEAAQAVWIDETDQIARFVCAIFALEKTQAGPTQLQKFTQTMISEQTAEA